MLISGTLLLLSCIALPLLAACVKWRFSAGERRIIVVVLGDTGRSPRMQYHSLSLLRCGYAVDLVGYGGSQLIPELSNSSSLKHHTLQNVPMFPGLPSLVRYVAKVLFQTCNLFWVILTKTGKSSYILMQTPPSVPTLIVCLMICWLRASKLIIDYHNYGHTLLALSIGYRHPLVRISKIYEEFLSQFAHSIICVTEAMKKDLERRLRVSATVFHDRPPERFKRTDVNQKHDLFLKLSTTFPAFADGGKLGETTVFTEVVCGKVMMKNDRPFFLISSTSWTEDEDFGILLDALEEYNAASLHTENHLPRLMCVITGKGPLKDHYMRVLQSKNFTRVTVCAPWLSAEDYPVLLGSADLGVSLHKSSSGFDLPMKVVDMFGCGLPVCALGFECIDELVKHNINGMVFSNSSELSSQLQNLCHGFPENNPNLDLYRENLSSYQRLRWDHYWKIYVLPQIRNV